MPITDEAIEEAWRQHRKSSGGNKEDYFGVLYLQREHGIPLERALNQVALHSGDIGVDGFHFDRERRNFYLYQFKYSESYQAFKPSFQRLLDVGMKRLFDRHAEDGNDDGLVRQVRATLRENQAIIDRFYFHFVFVGDPDAAEQSRVLDDMRESLEDKKYLIDAFLERDATHAKPVTLSVEFKSARSGRVGGATHVMKTRVYPLPVSEEMLREGPDGERMHLAFVRLVDLQAIFDDIGWRFFERNIRAALQPEEAVNMALRNAYKRILLEGREPPEVFEFNHNGVTLAAEQVTVEKGLFRVTAPRLLNGAQTVATFDRFLKDNQPNLTDSRRKLLGGLTVLCRILTNASDDFVTTVTINNNRQNPVEPWNLRANDRIQLELADLFRDRLQLLYARHQNLLRTLTDEDIGELGVQAGRAIEIYRLGQTFAVVDGEIDKLARMREVFEDDRLYEQLFSRQRLKADPRKIVLCYKAGLYAGRLVREVESTGPNKYDFVRRARNMLWALVCQAMLNDPAIEAKAEAWGRTLVQDMDFRKWLLELAKNRVRFILSDLVEDPAYAEKAAAGNYNFFKTSAAFKRAMDAASRRYGWTKRDLA